ncbi:hypothetical protein PoB_007338200 [Plakobranchus ocellatus]|uniref:Uncharacterized protein n=1 Tax=Plakobranchus ocellatus TaxID=259542 RepID=A0AAV4DRC7_9GAST|nr:hypothetical protein PoB_007338200 [Plakobranchus ocellatus]
MNSTLNVRFFTVAQCSSAFPNLCLLESHNRIIRHLADLWKVLLESFGYSGFKLIFFCVATRGGYIGGTADSKAALRSAEILLARFCGPPTILWSYERIESLRTQCCELVIHKSQSQQSKAPLGPCCLCHSHIG